MSQSNHDDSEGPPQHPDPPVYGESTYRGPRLFQALVNVPNLAAGEWCSVLPQQPGRANFDVIEHYEAILRAGNNPQRRGAASTPGDIAARKRAEEEQRKRRMEALAQTLWEQAREQQATDEILNMSPRSMGHAKLTSSPRGRWLQELLAQKIYPYNDKRPDTYDDTARHQMLLTRPQSLPEDSDFNDQDLFIEMIRSLEGTDKKQVSDKIGRLLVPEAVDSHLRGTTALNQPWSTCEPFLSDKLPAPDYTAGFDLAHLTAGQRERIGVWNMPSEHGESFTSPYHATRDVIFPFLFVESDEPRAPGVGSPLEDVAMLVNEYSAAVAIHGVLKLFHAVGRMEELDRRVLGFGVVHTHRSVRIVEYFPVLRGGGACVFQRVLREDDLASLRDPEDRWAAHRFVRNVYCHWAPAHYKLVMSAIDRLPLKKRATNIFDDNVRYWKLGC